MDPTSAFGISTVVDVLRLRRNCHRAWREIVSMKNEAGGGVRVGSSADARPHYAVPL